MCIGIHGLAEVIHSVFYTQVKHCHCNSSDSLLLFRCSPGCVHLCFTLHVPLDCTTDQEFSLEFFDLRLQLSTTLLLEHIYRTSLPRCCVLTAAPSQRALGSEQLLSCLVMQGLVADK